MRQPRIALEHGGFRTLGDIAMLQNVARKLRAEMPNVSLAINGNAAKDYVALAKALGGGWDAPVDASRPEIADEAIGPRLRSQPATP